MAKGVEVRDRSIRLAFTFEGRPQRRTLMLGAQPLEPTPANVKYAHRLAGEIRDRIRHGTFSIAEYFSSEGSGVPLTVGAQLDAWLAGQRIAHSTRGGYASAVRFWKATLADKPLRGLKTSDLLAALAGRAHLSGKTVNNYVSVLREALQLAVLDRMVPDNAAASVPRAKHQKPPVDPFTADEAFRIIAALPAGPIANLVEWWFFSGIRTSEMAGLRWAQVDLVSKRMQISEALVRGVAKSSTKTGVVRQVILNSRALAALQRQREDTEAAGEHVWLDPRYGTPWSEERAFRRSFWTPTLKRLGIRYRRPYNMRHTYATMMLMAGMTPAFCAGQMGHSVDIFLRTYAKWIPGAADAAEMAKLEASLEPKSRSPQVLPEGLSDERLTGRRSGVADGARTHDNRNHNPGLYQLSYSHRRSANYSERYSEPDREHTCQRGSLAASRGAVADSLMLTLKRFFSAA